MPEQLKTHQPPMNIDEQIDNLKDKGLIIKDEEYARSILNDISYFRLIKAFSLGLKEKNGKYYEGIEFEHIVSLYLFNVNLRQILFPQIERIEVNARCRISNYFSEKYGVLGYLDKNNFTDEMYYNQFIDDVESELSRNATPGVPVVISAVSRQLFQVRGMVSRLQRVLCRNPRFS